MTSKFFLIKRKQGLLVVSVGLRFVGVLTAYSGEDLCYGYREAAAVTLVCPDSRAG